MLVTVSRVSRSCEHFSDGWNLHLLPPPPPLTLSRVSGVRCRAKGSGCRPHLKGAVLGGDLHLVEGMHGFLTYKKTHHPRTLPQAYTYGPRGVLGG